ncbi:MAG: hypothetical protein KDB69_06185 [Acidimicrobiia bacterium]|nr:hypothetical protein [Acidimicrobiia bacterium]
MQLDHLYRETTAWESSVRFWADLGFEFEEQWGSRPHRAGRLTDGETSIVLAEVPSDPVDSVFLAVGDIEAVAANAGLAVIDTHWGTRMVSLTDPDGRVYNLEPRSAAS